MSRTHPAMWLLCGLLLSLASAAQSQERNVDTKRLPYNLADCLFRGWPRSGEWVTHDVTVEPIGHADEAAEKIRLIMQSELIPIAIEKGEAGKLYWFEVTFRKDAKSPPLYVAKLLVDLGKAKAGEWNLGQQKLVGWERKGDAEPTQFTEQSIHDSDMLQALIVPVDGKWTKQDPIDVPLKAGKLRCDHFRLQVREKEGELEFVSQLHPSIPFGCVRLTGQLEGTFQFDFQYSAHGTGARSDLPKHDYAALVAELAKEAAE